MTCLTLKVAGSEPARAARGAVRCQACLPGLARLVTAAALTLGCVGASQAADDVQVLPDEEPGVVVIRLAETPAMGEGRVDIGLRSAGEVPEKTAAPSPEPVSPTPAAAARLGLPFVPATVEPPAAEPRLEPAPPGPTPPVPGPAKVYASLEQAAADGVDPLAAGAKESKGGSGGAPVSQGRNEALATSPVAASWTQPSTWPAFALAHWEVIAQLAGGVLVFAAALLVRRRRA